MQKIIKQKKRHKVTAGILGGMLFLSMPVLASGNTFIESSTDRSVLRLTDAGVADYDFTFPTSYVLQLSTHTTSSKTLQLWNRGTGEFGLNVEGKVGIGTNNPNSTLHVHGKSSGILITRDGGSPYLALQNNNTRAILQLYESPQGLTFGVLGQGSKANYSLDRILLRSGGVIELDGAVSIGTTAPIDNFMLTVNGGIYALDLKIRPDLSNTADFVFEEDYTLMPLSEVKKQIQKNKHLPGIPSAQEMIDEGVSVANMQAKLLQKIEELTLYIIEQKDMLDKQQQEINKLHTQLHQNHLVMAPQG